MKKKVVEYLCKVFPNISKSNLDKIYSVMLAKLSQEVREGKSVYVQYFGRFQRKSKDNVPYYNPKLKKYSQKLRVWIKYKPTKHIRGKV